LSADRPISINGRFGTRRPALEAGVAGPSVLTSGTVFRRRDGCTRGGSPGCF
jgi:hypothetical protein